jgi:hypothetical protein
MESPKGIEIVEGPEEVENAEGPKDVAVASAEIADSANTRQSRECGRR